ncbi:MAG: hypothetical protein Q9193_003752 [Seirophora villosa]
MSRCNRDSDLEMGPPPASSAPSVARLKGYPSFAEFIAADADAAIYRKYERLSSRNLLYLQSELHELEEQLQELDMEDVKSRQQDNHDADRRAKIWSHYARAESEMAVRHRDLQSQIRSKLREYHEALILESRVLRLNAPSSRTLKAFKTWFRSNSPPVLWGRDKNLFDNEADLAALAPVETDRLNIFLQTYFGWFLQDARDKGAQDEMKNVFYFPDRRVQLAGAVISILLSAILLIGAIVCLVKVERQNTDLRVGLIVCFTSLFAAVVGLLTNARRAEIFAATAA